MKLHAKGFGIREGRHSAVYSCVCQDERALSADVSTLECRLAISCVNDQYEYILSGVNVCYMDMLPYPMTSSVMLNRHLLYFTRFQIDV